MSLPSNAPVAAKREPTKHTRFFLRFYDGHKRVAWLHQWRNSLDGPVAFHRAVIGSLADERAGRMVELPAYYDASIQEALTSVIASIASTHGPCVECVKGRAPRRAKLIADLKRLRALHRLP